MEKLGAGMHTCNHSSVRWGQEGPWVSTGRWRQEGPWVIIPELSLGGGDRRVPGSALGGGGRRSLGFLAARLYESISFRSCEKL